jgi:hypothetical protein
MFPHHQEQVYVTPKYRLYTALSAQLMHLVLQRHDQRLRGDRRLLPIGIGEGEYRWFFHQAARLRKRSFQNRPQT